MQTYIGHRGDVIYRQNDPTKYLYFIRSGEVELVQYVDVLITKDPDLNEQLLNTIRRNVHKTKFTNKTEHKVKIFF
jgi:signal-transduction protein with cAMP-binding, CBS, and nucleotidyltransferase domain